MPETEATTLFECPYWRVEAEPYSSADGVSRVWYTARRPNPETVHILGLTEEGTVPLLRQYRVPFRAWVWELPAGLCDVDGETQEATAARELLEESGYSAGEMHFLLRGTVTPGLSDEMWNGYLATGLCRESAGGGVHGEQIELHLLPLAELSAFLLAAAERGELLDSKLFSHIWLARCKLAELGITV